MQKGWVSDGKHTCRKNELCTAVKHGESLGVGWQAYMQKEQTLHGGQAYRIVERQTAGTDAERTKSAPHSGMQNGWVSDGKHTCRKS